MKAIVDLDDKEYKELDNIYMELKRKTNWSSKYVLLDNLRTSTGYAHYTFSGTISDKLVELLGRTPTPDEIIMLVDTGFSHFGATCSISGNTFNGRVNTD